MGSPLWKANIFCHRHHEKALLDDSEEAVSPLKVLKVSLNKTYSKKVSKVRFLPLNPPTPEKNDEIDKIEGNVQSSTECRLQRLCLSQKISKNSRENLFLPEISGEKYFREMDARSPVQTLECSITA
jgi:hypothetical protein